MSDFERVERYIVIKRSDFITEQDEKSIRAWLEKIHVPTLECVVVDHDWPIYEEAWENVQRWAEGRSTIGQERDALAAELVEARRQLAMMRGA